MDSSGTAVPQFLTFMDLTPFRVSAQRAIEQRRLCSNGRSKDVTGLAGRSPTSGAD